uniref:IS66 family transposase n=1 Tax=Aliiroseovarius halocynthiae TaxID=985055 RepID=UPI001FE93C45|nr:transposase [Aliiroseovarius halocynthiae]
MTEELEYLPGRFVVNRIVRPRMPCRDCDLIVQSALPSRPIERGRPGPGLLAYVPVGKYADHCPLYRQSQIYGRDGIDLDRPHLQIGSVTLRHCWNRWLTRLAAAGSCPTAPIPVKATA